MNAFQQVHNSIQAAFKKVSAFKRVTEILPVNMFTWNKLVCKFEI